MKRILLLIGHKENRRLLAEWLSQYYEVIVPEDLNDLQERFDLGLVDSRVLNLYAAMIRARKQAEQPLFLPILLMANQEDMGIITNSIWESVDEMIVTPTEKAELKVRIDILLRVRQLGLELKNSNDQLMVEVRERQQAEQRLRTTLRNTRQLYNASQQISVLREPQDMLKALNDHYPRPANHAEIILFNRPWLKKRQPPDSYEVLATLNHSLPWAEALHRTYPLRHHPCSKLFVSEYPLMVTDTVTYPFLKQKARKDLLNANLCAMLLFPLRARGQWYGMLNLYSYPPNRWDDEDRHYLHSLGEQVAVTLDNLRLLEAEAAARREAERANELKMRFLAMISHELRTPLTPILGFASSLLAEDVVFGPEDQREFVKVIDDEARKLTRLVEELIDVSRLQAGNFKVTRRMDSFNEVIKTAAAQFHMLTRAHQFNMEIDQTLPPLMLDRGRIAQVLVNLVGNAAKFAPPGTQIKLRASPYDGFLEVRVTDEGPGIPMHEREVVFDVFRQGEPQTARPQDGAGLGLAICKGIVEAHGGRIWIADNPPPGTTMVFTLPLALAPITPHP